jgi:hypothetical protein
MNLIYGLANISTMIAGVNPDSSAASREFSTNSRTVVNKDLPG